MFVALSGQIIIIVDPSVSRFEGMIQKFEVTATGLNVCGAWNIDKEHCSPIALSFLAHMGVIHDDGFVRGWTGVFTLENCPFAC